jgi:phage/plasmid-associated DNA primase
MLGGWKTAALCRPKICLRCLRRRFSHGGLLLNSEFFWADLRARETHTIFAPEERLFYRYNPANSLYESWSNEQILADFDDRIFRAANSWPAKWYGLLNLRSARTIEPIIKYFRGITEMRDAFRSLGHWQPVIACKNCLVRIDPNQQKILKEDFNHKYRLRHASPFVYDPKAKCPLFREKILGHLPEDDQSLLQKLGGQAILGRNLCQRIVLLDGQGGSSKSAFVGILRGVVGPHACAELRTSLLNERFEIGAIARASLLCGADVPGDFLSSRGAARLKALVGSDGLECEYKNSNVRLLITGLFNIFITANTTLHLRLSGDYGAWLRRLVRICYDAPYSGKRIDNIDQHLLEQEGAGILNFFLDGALALLAELAVYGDVVLSEKQRRVVQKLMDKSNSLETFLSTEIQRSEHGTSDGLSTDFIVAQYLEYCERQGWDAIKSSEVRKRLPDLMSQLFGVGYAHNLERGGKKKCPRVSQSRTRKSRAAHR